jgi:hypothetical protein
MIIGKEEEGRGRGVILIYYPSFRLEGPSKTMKNLNQNSRSSGKDLNAGPLEYEALVLITRPRQTSLLLRH